MSRPVAEFIEHFLAQDPEPAHPTATIPNSLDRDGKIQNGFGYEAHLQLTDRHPPGSHNTRTSYPFADKDRNMARILDTARSVGFIGLGNMGGALSARLVEHGVIVLGYDPTDEACQRARLAGVRVEASAADVARHVEFVILMLPNSDVVEAVVTDPLFESALIERGATLIDMSSSNPASTRTLADRLSQLGVSFLDAPVSGGVVGAKNGTLTIAVGGRDDTFAAAFSILAILGNPRHAGRVGAGHAFKAINNLLSATHLVATAEGVVIGERFGLEPELMIELLNSSSGRSGSTENKFPNFVLPGTFDSGFGLRLMLKDMKIATELGTQLGVAPRLGSYAVSLWDEASNILHPAADHTEIAAWIDRDSYGDD